MAEYNIQKIRDILSQNIADVSQKTLSQQLKILQRNISQYLLSFSLFEMQIKTMRTHKENLFASIQAEEKSLNYSIYKGMLEYKKDIEKLMKDGYEIIHRLREWLTGQVITYQIGTEYRGKLYEHSYSLEDILNYAQIQYAGKNIISLRLHMNKSTVKEDAENLQKQLQSTIDKGSTVFSHVFRYFYPSQGGKRPINKGNAYEVYRSIIAERKWENPNKIPIEIDYSPENNEASFFDARLSSIRSNTIAGYKGGDVLTQQDKFISHDPSLISIVSIRKVLTSFNEGIKNYNNSNELYKNMVSLFTKDDYRDSITEKIEIETLNKATQTLKKNIDKLSIILNGY